MSPTELKTAIPKLAAELGAIMTVALGDVEGIGGLAVAWPAVSIVIRPVDGTAPFRITLSIEPDEDEDE